MSSRRPRLTIGSEWLRRRLIWTVVFVLISLGGAGLVAAVDRPHTQAQRPELGWSADHQAQPWFEAMLLKLETIEQNVADLSGAGRAALVALATPRLAELPAGLRSGDEASARLAAEVAELLELRAQVPEGAEPWRLGEARRQLLDSIDAAAEACRNLESDWAEMRGATDIGARIIDALERHDELVLDALAAGRDARWTDAVELLERALPRLDEAEAAAAELRPAEQTEVTTDLLGRHRAHDRALLRLYRLLAEIDSLDDPRVELLRRRVEAARLPLPTPAAIVQAVTAETALPPLTAGLGLVEVARGRVADALRPAEEEEGE